MQKLFENWRRYAEAKDWDPNTSGRAAPRGIPDGADSPTPPDVDPADKKITTRPLFKTLDSFTVDSVWYAALRKSNVWRKEFPHDRARSKDEYIKEFPTINHATKEATKEVLKKWLRARHISIITDNITFVI